MATLVIGDSQISICSDIIHSEFRDSKGFLFVCERCIGFFDQEKYFIAHILSGNCNGPVGQLVARLGANLLLFEVSGDREPETSVVTRLASLFRFFVESKTFLHDKHLFRFYCLYKANSLVGYFAKDVQSGQHVSCIAVLPQYRRSKLGTQLLSLAYEIAGKLGSAERPVSQDGRHLFLAFWKSRIQTAITSARKTRLSINEVASLTKMTPSDVHFTAHFFGMLRIIDQEQSIVLDPDERERGNDLVRCYPV